MTIRSFVLMIAENQHIKNSSNPTENAGQLPPPPPSPPSPGPILQQKTSPRLLASASSSPSTWRARPWPRQSTCVHMRLTYVINSSKEKEEREKEKEEALTAQNKAR